jgi:hypothetical protein
VVDEFAVAERLGLHHSVRLLATVLVPDDPAVVEAGAGDDDAAMRRALVAAVRSRRRTGAPT